MIDFSFEKSKTFPFNPILITFGRGKYMLLRIYIGLSMSVTLKSPSRSIPDIPQVVFDF
jgi:hypothetical protein